MTSPDPKEGRARHLGLLRSSCHLYHRAAEPPSDCAGWAQADHPLLAATGSPGLILPPFSADTDH